MYNLELKITQFTLTMYQLFQTYTIKIIRTTILIKRSRRKGGTSRDISLDGDERKEAKILRSQIVSEVLYKSGFIIQ